MIGNFPVIFFWVGLPRKLIAWWSVVVKIKSEIKNLDWLKTRPWSRPDFRNYTYHGGGADLKNKTWTLAWKKDSWIRAWPNYFYLNVIFSGFLPESHKGAAVGGDDANHWRLCQGGGPAGATLHHASCLKFLAKTKYHAFWPRPVLLLVLGDWCEQFHSDEDMFF